jgi:aminoglycoside phosphotransferase (APT) family kinase protein
MPDIDQRDPGEVAGELTRWLATKSDQRLEVFDVQAPASNGFSNETILCRTRTIPPAGGSANGPAAGEAGKAAGEAGRAAGEARKAAGERRMVVRVAPTKHLLFMDAEFSTQYRVMKSLADGGSAVPLPSLGWYEEDPQYLGVPFFTMDHVEGNVPPDNIPYTMEGWVVEAAPEQQERMWWSGIDALAAVHRTDWRSLGLHWLSDGKRGRPGIQQQMSYYRDYLDWATKGIRVPVIESTWQWLVEHQPAEDGDVVLSWGDSRIGNIIWDDFQCAAVLDWEMASLGQPEMDLGWYLYFDRQFTEPLGVPRPAGFGSHEDTIERYGELMGRPMQDVFFYEVFSGFRFAVIMYRLSDLVFGKDVVDETPDMATNNLATQLLASMLDLEPPG